MDTRTHVTARLRSIAINLAPACALMLPTSLYAQTIYKCVDLDGFVTYSSLQCEDQLEITDSVITEPEWPQGQSPRSYSRGGSSNPPSLGEAQPELDAGESEEQYLPDHPEPVPGLQGDDTPPPRANTKT